MIEDAVNNATVDYSLINKVVFTKTNVYLMIAKNQGYMLLKSNFPEGLEAFLKQIKPKKSNLSCCADAKSAGTFLLLIYKISQIIYKIRLIFYLSVDFYLTHLLFLNCNCK